MKGMATAGAPFSVCMALLYRHSASSRFGPLSQLAYGGAVNFFRCPSTAGVFSLRRTHFLVLSGYYQNLPRVGNPLIGVLWLCFSMLSHDYINSNIWPPICLVFRGGSDTSGSGIPTCSGMLATTVLMSLQAHPLSEALRINLWYQNVKVRAGPATRWMIDFLYYLPSSPTSQTGKREKK